jgi:hypothetical protein
VRTGVATLIPRRHRHRQSFEGPEGTFFRAFVFFCEVRAVERERVGGIDNEADGIGSAAIGGVNARWLAIFEERYGTGAYGRLIALFGQPCVTFASIADQFGVTRERVRQWHLVLMPGAPRGHERQRLCGLYQQKRRLLAEPLFRSFYQHARPHLEPGADRPDQIG